MRFHRHRYHWYEIATPFVLLRARNDKIDMILLVANAPHNTEIVCQSKSRLLQLSFERGLMQVQFSYQEKENF